MHCSALSLSSLSHFSLFHSLSSLCTLSLPLLIMINVQQRLCVCVYDCVHVCGVCLPEAEMKLKQLLTPPTAPLP